MRYYIQDIFKLVFINYAENKINCKIVYYGTGKGGKTTNIKYIYSQLGENIKSSLTTLDDLGDRTLFFDFLSLDLGKIKDFDATFNLYTVPGQINLNPARKLILNSTDGIIFVVDSTKEKLEENKQNYQNLINNLKEYDKKISDIPIVFQYNKRDDSNALSIDILEKELNINNHPYLEATAINGQGVFSALKTVSNLILTRLQ